MRSRNSDLEVWAHMKDRYPKYAISNFGRIMNVQTGMILRPKITRGGHMMAKFQHSCNIEYVAISRLVATYHRRDYHGGYIYHLDGDVTNNHPENLWWKERKA